MSTSTDQGEPNITKTGGAHNSEPSSAGESDPRAPTRAELDGSDWPALKIGGPTKADLRVVDLGFGGMVVKDFGHKSWWVRQIGRFQIRREVTAYRWLGRLPGVPRFYGRIDAYALAMQKLDAEQLGTAEVRHTHGQPLMAGLREVVDGIHERGLVHLDLRARENVLVGKDLSVWVLDFATGLWMTPGGRAFRWWFRRLRMIDESALIKWKLFLKAGPLTPEEQRFRRRYRFWRSLWIFNPKFGRPKEDL